MSTPYAYIIGWSKLNVWYYGVRYSKTCHPSDLWHPYKTSSKYVKQMREYCGEPDVLKVRKTFTNMLSAREWETKVLRRLKIKNNPKFLNKTDGSKYFFSTETSIAKGSNKRRGKKHSLISRKNMSYSQKNIPKTEEHKTKISIAKKGQQKSLECRQKISQSRLGKYPESANHLNKMKYHCILCNKTMNKGNFIRWHINHP